MENAVWLLFGISPQDLFLGSRIRKLSDIRHMAFHILRNDAGCTFPEIERLTGKDHATAIHSCHVADACMRYADFKEQYTKLKLTFLTLMESTRLFELISRYVTTLDCEKSKDSAYDKFRDDCMPYASLTNIRLMLLTDKDKELIKQAEDFPDCQFDLIDGLVAEAETTSGVYFLTEIKKRKYHLDECRNDY